MFLYSLCSIDIMDTLIPGGIKLLFQPYTDPLKLENLLPHLFIIILPLAFIFLHLYNFIFLIVLFKLFANQGNKSSVLCVAKFPLVYHLLFSLSFNISV